MLKIKKDSHTSADKAKEKYHVLNWSDYNKALVNRGSSTIYFSDEALRAGMMTTRFREADNMCTAIFA